MCTMSVQYQQSSEERIGSPGTRVTCNCMDTGNKSKSSSRAVNVFKLLTISLALTHTTLTITFTLWGNFTFYRWWKYRKGNNLHSIIWLPVAAPSIVLEVSNSCSCWPSCSNSSRMHQLVETPCWSMETGLSHVQSVGRALFH